MADSGGIAEFSKSESANVALYVGCASWAHRPWVGRYLSAQTPVGRELEAYAQWCNAVEGNTTHYATPAGSTVQRWADMAPPTFRFAFKLPREVTHERRLRNVEPLVTDFLDVIAPLGDRIGPLTIQLPPSFGPESVGALISFIGTLDQFGPAPSGWAVEVRHRVFFDHGGAHRALDAALAEHGVSRIVLDARPVHSVSPRTDAAVQERSSKPLRPIITEEQSRHPVVRLIGCDDTDLTWNAAEAWIPTVVSWLEAGRCPFVFIHQPENLDSLELAHRFHSAVAAIHGPLTPLPEPPPAAPSGEVPGQGSLW